MEQGKGKKGQERESSTALVNKSIRGEVMMSATPHGHFGKYSSGRLQIITAGNREKDFFFFFFCLKLQIKGWVVSRSRDKQYSVGQQLKATSETMGICAEFYLR